MVTGLCPVHAGRKPRFHTLIEHLLLLRTASSAKMLISIRVQARLKVRAHSEDLQRRRDLCLGGQDALAEKTAVYP